MILDSLWTAQEHTISGRDVSINFVLILIDVNITFFFCLCFCLNFSFIVVTEPSNLLQLDFVLNTEIFLFSLLISRIT
jgi:hypothetical protein